MHEDFPDTFAPGKLEQRIQVGDVRMDPSVGYKSGKVETASCSLDAGNAVEHYRIREEVAVIDRFADAGQVLINDASGPHIQVPHLRVAHLPFGEPYRHAGGADIGAGVFGAEARHVRRAGLGDGIVFGLGIDSPSVQYHQQQRLFWHVSSIR